MPDALIAMSGGVDSSAAAILTQAAGYRCTGVTLHLHDFAGCGAAKDTDDARAAAERLGMSHRVLDACGTFDREVIQKFIRVYEQGGTPNPCIDCNRNLKFGLLLDTARQMGCEILVTGHYARIEQRADGRRLLKKGLDPAKDQSYVLYMLTQDQLAHIRFPLGGMEKADVRALAESRGLANAHKSESQDICFVPDGDYSAFIRRTTGRDYPPGDFVDADGHVLGKHRGIIDYTVGQRRGLGVSGGRPLYVCRKNMDTNTVVLTDNEALFRTELDADGVNLIDRDSIDAPLRCAAKIRYRHTEQPCTVTQPSPGRLHIVFDSPQRAITAGQAVVLYDGETVIGGGTILEP